jgi:hypothetical protein
MKTRRDFFKTTVLGAGALSLTPYLDAFGAAAKNNGFPKRFVFIRKSNGERPNEVALPSLSEKDKALDEKKQPLVVDLDRHELPVYLQGLEKHKANMTILQGLSCMMSENGHMSYSSVMGAFKSNQNSISGIKRATIDFELAKRTGTDRRLRQIQDRNCFRLLGLRPAPAQLLLRGSSDRP